VSGLDGRGEADGEQPSGLERLTQGCVRDSEVTGDRMDLPLARGSGTLERRLALVEPGQPRAGRARMACGPPVGTDKARRWLCANTALAPTRGGAMPLAWPEGRHGGGLRLDDWTGAALVARRAPRGWLPDVRLGAPRPGARLGATLAWGRASRGRPVQAWLGWVSTRGEGLAKRQALLLRVASQCHQDGPLPSALAANTPPACGQLLGEGVGLPPEARGLAAALLRDVFAALQGFVCALYSVGAAVTR
jgi:hypothetical protein